MPDGHEYGINSGPSFVARDPIKVWFQDPEVEDGFVVMTVYGHRDVELGHYVIRLGQPNLEWVSTYELTPAQLAEVTTRWNIHSAPPSPPMVLDLGDWAPRRDITNG